MYSIRNGTENITIDESYIKSTWGKQKKAFLFLSNLLKKEELLN